MDFSRQEYQSRLPFSTPRNFPDPGIDPTSLTSALAGRFFVVVVLFFPTAPPGKPSRPNQEEIENMNRLTNNEIETD